MILTEPASAVSQPKPTPATADKTANTTAKISTDVAAATRNARTGWYPRRSRKWRIHTQTRNGNEIPAVALTAIATVITVMPRTFRPWKRQRDAGGHQAHHQHLVVHAAHQVDRAPAG